MKIDNNEMSSISRLLGLGEMPADWDGVDVVWPILERIRADGCIVLIKLDGERTGPDDNGPYTVLISGKPLDGDFFRIDHHDLKVALSSVIVQYAKRKWGYLSVAGDGVV